MLVGDHEDSLTETIVETITQPLLVLDAELRVRVANAAFLRHFEVSTEQTVGRVIYELGNGQWDIPELRRLLGDILPKEQAFDDFEVEHEFDRIGRRLMLLNARRLDHIDQIVLAIRDITEQRARERRREAFADELQHRVRNLLNNVGVLASHTRRNSDSLDGFMAAFEDRLGALARTQDMLLRSPSEPLALAELLRLELTAVGAKEGEDFDLDGPMVLLAPNDAQTMAMALHELTTNAARHGALRADDGFIDIDWLIEEGAAPKVRFHWRERGVEIPDTDPPRGFGSKVIGQNLPYMLGGTAEMTFHPDGLDCRVEFPLPG